MSLIMLCLEGGDTRELEETELETEITEGHLYISFSVKMFLDVFKAPIPHTFSVSLLVGY